MSEHELWNELGNLYFLSGSYNQAVNAYRRSIGLDANFGRPYSNLALAYVQQGRYEEAIELYRASIELLADEKEKAISWNRLGAVYRHLKDYSKAVIAFQEADELDPQSVDEFPAAPDARPEDAPAPSSVLDEPPADDQKEVQSEVAWWDIEEDSALAARLAEQAFTDLPEDLTASWTPADLGQYQQDLSQMPDSGSLTTWGDPDFDEDFEVLSPLDPEPDLHIPGPDDDDVATWLPIPEEERASLDEIETTSVQEPVMPEPDPQPDWNKSPYYHVINSMDFAPLLPARAVAAGIPEHAERNEPGHNRQTGAKQAWEPQEVDVDVQDRLASDYDYAFVPQEPTESISSDPPEAEVQSDLVPTPALDMTPALPEVPILERDADEQLEIETGIAKFKRVVQLNPRNAHAWDALGTLYKSAGQYKDAILAYQQAISNDPSKSLYYHHLGLVYACEGRDEDAIGAFQRVIEIDPEYSLAHATLGGYYRKMGLEELAQKHIGKAMKNIFDSENEYNRACLEAICGNADQAIKLLGVALKNKQTYVDWILRDPDLDFIRQDPRFKQLISDYTR